MRRLGALLAIAIGAPLLASETQPLTKVTVRAMPPQVLARRLFGELGRIMVPAFYRGRPGTRATRPLYALEFLTIPTATRSPGLCQSATVTVRFAPDGPLRGADTPVRPTGIEASQLYVVADLARLRRADELNEAERRQLGAACAEIDPRNVPKISAPDENMLVADVRIFANLLEAIRANPKTTLLNCAAPYDRPPTSGSVCLQELLQLDIRQISTVDTCQPPPPNPARCFWLYVGGMSVRLESDSAAAPPSRVTIEPMIVIADERID